MADQQHLPALERPLQYLQTEEPECDLVEEIQTITGYRFNSPNILKQAFTDPSYAEDDCNSFERLEFFGDSVLDHLIAEDLYLSYPDLHPGKLTRLRAANVDTEKLARVAVKYNLHKYLRHNKPLLAGQIEEFKQAILDYPLHSYGLVDAPKVLADIVESFIGAIHIDCNRSWDTTWQIVKSLLQPMITPETLQMHPVTNLYELCQKHGSKLQIVDLFWKKSGEIEVYIDDQLAGRGKYCAKKLIAINRAADNAYKQYCNKVFVAESVNNDEKKFTEIKQ